MQTKLTNKEKYGLLMNEDKSSIVKSFISLGNAYDKMVEDINSHNSQKVNEVKND